ncbi:MAG: NUDIX domain-containing protein [Spirochaetales bacterium]|nr:NUDIX domain-containing protein [Spirochaetales bacterium]
MSYERTFFWTGSRPSEKFCRSEELAFLPNTGLWDMRLLKQNSLPPALELSLQQDQSLKRTKVLLDQEASADLWEQAPDRIVRHGVPLEKIVSRGKKLSGELFFYAGPLAGLKTAVVRFASPEQARLFRPPRYFGYELTFDPRFREQSLAQPQPTLPLSAEASATWAFGGLPFRQKGGQTELVIISTRGSETTRGSSRWIFPKGQPEKGLTPAQVAVMECHEEAGVGGNLVGHPLLLPFHRDSGIDNLVLFPLRVKKWETTWREAGQRERLSIRITEVDPQVHGDFIVRGAQALLDLYA